MTTESDDWSLLPMEAFVPHTGRMSLLHRVLRCDGDELEAEARITPEQLFMDTLGAGQGVGAWVGIELMAQAVAAWAGVQGRARGQAPRIGLLLGCRNYRATQTRFNAGDCLRIRVRQEFQADNGLGQFDCTLALMDGTVEVEVARARLTVFGPEDPQAFLEEPGHHE